MCNQAFGTQVACKPTDCSAYMQSCIMRRQVHTRWAQAQRSTWCCVLVKDQGDREPHFWHARNWRAPWQDTCTGVQLAGSDLQKCVNCSAAPQISPAFYPMTMLSCVLLVVCHAFPACAANIPSYNASAFQVALNWVICQGAWLLTISIYTHVVTLSCNI